MVKEEGHDRDQEGTGVSKGTGLWICIQSQHVQRKALGEREYLGKQRVLWETSNGARS